jgi:membrane-associated phospholipid phosphatase
MERKQWTGLMILWVSLWGVVPAAYAQDKDSLSKITEVPKELTDSLPFTQKKYDPYLDTFRINVPFYFQLLGSNLKRQFTSPLRLTGKDWGDVAKLALVAGAVSFADHAIQRQALTWRNNSSTLRSVSGHITEFGGLYEGYTLAALGAYGFLFKKQKMKNTVLLATQSYITAAAVGTLVKVLTTRRRPDYYGDAATSPSARFNGPFGWFGDYQGAPTNSSFPSGHATVAFAAATVFAKQYPEKVWVPILSYSAASLIALSRITQNKHWASDVVVGSALGYVSGLLVVNNFRRRALKKKEPTAGTSLHLQLQYSFGQLQPALIYSF